MDESVRRMIVDIACDAFPVIIRAASLPASVKWKSNIVGSVDYCPQCFCARSKTAPFRVTDAFRKKSPVSTLQIIPVDGTADRVAGRVFRVRVAGRGDVYVQVTVRTDRQILQLMAVGSSKFRAAGVWQIWYNHLSIEQPVAVGIVAESTDLIRFTDVNVSCASDRSKNHPVRMP